MGIHIEAIAKKQRVPELICKLLRVWVLSVRASHHFLTEADIVRLTPQAEGALQQIETLWIVKDDLEPIGFMGIVKDDLEPIGFMGVQDRKIEMLFLHPDYFHQGLGKALVNRAFDELNVEFVDVNEQNPDALKFYEHMGFKVFKRNEYDSEGNPFPILELKRIFFNFSKTLNHP